MAKRILDTSILIHHWFDFSERQRTERTPETLRRWADRLIDIYDTNLIATPVFIEMVAGVRSAEELKLTLAYLEPFVVIDDGRIPPADWQRARQHAQRVPRDGRPRQMGDCLIRAIAARKGCEVATHEKHFPR